MRFILALVVWWNWGFLWALFTYVLLHLLFPVPRRQSAPVEEDGAERWLQ